MGGGQNLEIATKVRTSGPYEGEIEAPCDKYSGTMKIPGVTFTSEEAQNIRTHLNLEKEEFHLKADSSYEGTYCFYFENGADNEYMYNNFRCSDVDESSAAWYFKQTPFIRHLPTGNNSRCVLIKNTFAKYAGKHSSFADKSEDGIIIGAGFALSAVTLNGIIKKLTGKSIIDRFRNGGPKGPSDPGDTSTPSGGAPAANPSSSSSPVPATPPPETMIGMSPLPPPPKEAWYTLAVTTILTTGAMLALKAREAAAVIQPVISTVRDIGSAINGVKVGPFFMFEFQKDLIEQGNPYINPGSHAGPS